MAGGGGASGTPEAPLEQMGCGGDVGGWRYSNPLEVTLRTPAIVISRAAKDLLLCIPSPIAEICQQTKFVLSYCLV